MEADEFRNALLRKMEGSGIDGEIRSFITQKFVNTIKEPPLLQKQSSVRNYEQSNPVNKDLRGQLAHSIVAEFLSENDFNVTRDVFISELNKINAPILLSDELEEFSSHLPSHGFKQNLQYKLPLLERLIAHMIHMKTRELNTKNIQTDDFSHHNQHQIEIEKCNSLFETELRKIYSKDTPTIKNQEENLKNSRKLLNQEYDEKLKRDILHFKEIELRKTRIEIEKNYFNQNEELRLFMEKQFHEKMKRVNERENEIVGVFETKVQQLENKEVELRKQELMNLNRINESDQQINSMKAEKFRELSNKELLLDERESRLFKKESVIESLKCEQELEQKLMADSNKFENMKSNVNNLLYETQKHKNLLETANSSRKMLEERVDNLDRQNSLLNAEVSKKERFSRELQEQIDDQNQHKRRSEDQLQLLESNIKFLQETDERTKKNLTDSDTQLQEFKENYNKLFTEYENLRAQIYEIDHEKNKYYELYIDVKNEFEKKEEMEFIDREELKKLREGFGKLKQEKSNLLDTKINDALTNRPCEYKPNSTNPRDFLKEVSEKMESMKRNNLNLQGSF